MVNLSLDFLSFTIFTWSGYLNYSTEWPSGDPFANEDILNQNAITRIKLPGYNLAVEYFVFWCYITKQYQNIVITTLLRFSSRIP